VIPVWTLPVVAGAFWVGILAEGSLDRGPGMVGSGGMMALGLVGVCAAIALMERAAWDIALTQQRKLVAGVMLCASFLSLGAGWAGLREARVRWSPLAALAGHAVGVVASVQESPQAGRFGWTASVTADVVSRRGSSQGLRISDPLWIEGHGPVPALRPGDRVAAEGPLSIPAGPFGSWLRHRGYAAVLSTDRIQRLGPSGDPVRRVAEGVRAAFGRSVRRAFSSPDDGLLMGLALGDTSRLDPGIEEDFRATGLSHLTAVSGENLAMFLAPIMGLLGLVQLGRKARFAVGAGAVGFFVLLTGAEPSVLRAAAMTGLTLLGVFLGRPRSPPAILGAAVLVLLVINPTLVYSIGFQLSVAATGGMALLANPLSVRLGFLPRSLALAAGTTMAAQIGVGPLLLYQFGLVPLVSLPANLLAFPAVAPAMLLGLLAAAIGSLVPVLGGGVALLARLPVRYLEALAHRLARSPLPSVTSPVGRMGELLIGSCVVLGLGWLLRSGIRPSRRTAVAAALMLPVFVWSSALRAGPPSGLTVTFFYVGWGDGAVIRSPSGATILIDGGADLELVARKLSALGIRRLDVLVATHPHEDHVAGLAAVLVRFPVGLVLDPGCRGQAPAYADFLRAVDHAEVPVRHPRPGAEFLVGDLRLEVLGPSHCFHGTHSDANNDSLVLRVLARGASVLFTGDAEEPAQSEILEDDAARLTAAVLKVPHHGGATTLEQFFRGVHARVAVVSVGPNRYGHPVPEILAELVRDGMRVFRTDRDGDVTIVFRGGDILVQTGA
jgi:competence protein ComEC